MSAPGQLVAFVTLAFSGFACALDLSAQANPVGEFQVQEVWSTEGKEVAGGLTAIAGLVEAGDGRIWMVDLWGAAGRVLVLDPATMIATVIGQAGDGPGEVRIPAHMTVTPDGGVAVLDAGRSAIEIYEGSGAPVHRVQLQEPILGHRGFAALASGGYVVTGYLRSSGSAVHYFDPNGGLILGWSEHPVVPGAPLAGSPWRNNLERDAAMAQIATTGGWVHARPDGSFLYSQAAPHKIVHFEASSPPGNGWVERPLVSMLDLFEAPGLKTLEYTKLDDGQTSVGYDMTWPRSGAVFEMSSGYILNVVIMEQEDRSLWQVFEPLDAVGTSGAALVMEASVDRVYTPWFLCENGDVLATVTNPATGVDHAVRLRLGGIPSRGVGSR
ncbi:MAG: hypothetical protein OXU74_05120 [Gemmatimonadota bacterium]|nr:hypothetical protein [Gemmatimonadota bacterium]